MLLIILTQCLYLLHEYFILFFLIIQPILVNVYYVLLLLNDVLNHRLHILLHLVNLKMSWLVQIYLLGFKFSDLWFIVRFQNQNLLFPLVGQ